MQAHLTPNDPDSDYVRCVHVPEGNEDVVVAPSNDPDDDYTWGTP